MSAIDIRARGGAQDEGNGKHALRGPRATLDGAPAPWENDPDFSPDVIAARCEDDAADAERAAMLAERSEGDPIAKLGVDAEALCQRTMLRLQMARRTNIADAPGPREIVADLVRAVTTLEQGSRPKPRVPTLVERARSLGSSGPRLSTGLEPLDAETRGGIPARRVVVLGGAPGAGKTMLAVQFARRWAAEGCAVAILAADEDADGLLVRWGQSIGLAREELENGVEGAREHLAVELEGVADRVLLIDGSASPDHTVAHALDLLMGLSPADGWPRVLVVDSIQTAQAWAPRRAPSSTAERAEAVVAELLAARSRGVLVVATSELSRAAYKGGREGGINLLASGKDSGDIEYRSDLFLAMLSVRGERDAVDVVAPKNRLGPSGEEPFCRLELDRERATFGAGSLPAAATDDEDTRETRRSERAMAAATRDAAVIAVAMAMSPGLGRRELNAAAKARGGVSKDRVYAALDRLGTAVVVRSGSNRREHHYLGSPPDDAIMALVPTEHRQAVLLARPPAERETEVSG